MRTLLRDGLVFTPAGIERADVLVDGDTVAAVGSALDVGAGADVVECASKLVGPGFVDLHTHLREPGAEWKEDIASGSAAAAAGGFTAVVAMPNTVPPVDDGHHARFVRERGRSAAGCEVVPAGCLTVGREGDALAHFDSLADAGVSIFTDDGDWVLDAGLLRRAMEYVRELGGVVAQHVEDAGLVAGGHMHEGVVSAGLGMAGRPGLAEEMALARDLALVRATGVRYHAQHISTARAVELIAAAKSEGLQVTAEVTPHHLFFEHEAARGTNPAFKMNPPLRPESDRAAVREALMAGVIDAVATDHAPHSAFEKDVPFEEAPPGVIGLETAAAAVVSAVDLTPEQLFDRLAVRPARIASLERQGHVIAPGSPANIVVFDPEAVWSPRSFQSKSANSPFVGETLRGRVVATIVEGVPAPAPVPA